MKYIVLLICLMVSSVQSTQAQQVIYDANAELRSVSKFSAIDVSGTISLFITQGETAGIAVSAGDEKYNEKIKTAVVDGVLKIAVDAGLWNGFSWSDRKLKAYVSVVDLSHLSVSGASLVNVGNNLESSALTISVSGASEIKAKLAVKDFKLDISGASVANLTGIADNAAIEASGAAKVNGYNFEVKNGNVQASGASQIKITVSKELNVNASGGSAIHYKGTALVRNANATSGAIIKKN